MPIPTANKQKYQDFVRQTWPTFRQLGALRLVETWSITTPDSDPGKIRGPLKTTADETVVFSWIEWPDQATADAAWAKIMSGEQPVESDDDANWERMIWGGFELLFDSAQDA